jgi:hypothetical protein
LEGFKLVPECPWLGPLEVFFRKQPHISSLYPHCHRLRLQRTFVKSLDATILLSKSKFHVTINTTPHTAVSKTAGQNPSPRRSVRVCGAKE